MLTKKASENQAPHNRHMSRLTSNQAPDSEALTTAMMKTTLTRLIVTEEVSFLRQVQMISYRVIWEEIKKKD